MRVGDKRRCQRAEFASPSYPELEPRAVALRKAACILIRRGYPFRVCERRSPGELSPWMVDRLEVLAFALGRLQREDLLAHAAIARFDLSNGRRWPANPQQRVRALGCRVEQAREASWRGWCKMATWLTCNCPQCRRQQG